MIKQIYDYEDEQVFVLEKTDFQFVPKYKSLEEVEELVDKSIKSVYGCMWASFCISARNIINHDMQEDKPMSIRHKTLGCCPPTVFYLYLHDLKGAQQYSWTETKKWNGLYVKQHCIQFRFKGGHLPVLHTHSDWANFAISSNHETGEKDIGRIERTTDFRLSYISLTCNTISNEVYASYKFEKKFSCKSALYSYSDE